MRIWLTKHALTEGIKEAEGEVDSHCRTMVCYGPKSALFAHGKDWHINRDAAVKRAEEMRKKRIASLRKQIEKLEAMDFK